MTNRLALALAIAVVVLGVLALVAVVQGWDAGAVVGLGGVVVAGLALILSSIERTATYRGALFVAQVQAAHDVLVHLYALDLETAGYLADRSALGCGAGSMQKHGDRLAVLTENLSVARSTWAFVLTVETLRAVEAYTAVQASVLMETSDPTASAAELRRAYDQVVRTMRAETGTDPLTDATLPLIGGGAAAAQRRADEARLRLAVIDVQIDVMTAEARARQRRDDT